MIKNNNLTKNLTKKIVNELQDDTLPFLESFIVNSDHEEDSEHEADVLLADPELKEPPKYAVVMYNDNYTPMDFVVFVLMSEFRHTQDEAVQIMLNIHQNGKGIAGIYVKDIAETKANKVNSIAKREGFPLMTQIEPYKD